MADKVYEFSKQSWFLVLLAIIVLGAGIWSPGVITQGDESDYITSSREMFKNGDLLTPTLQDEARFTKPPLLYWLINLSYQLFGVSLFSSRLPSVLAGVLLALAVFRFGEYLYGREAGTISALFTITSFGMIKFSKIALMEVPLALFILLTFYYYLNYLDSGQKSKLLLSSVFLGLVALLKSPVYSVFCLVVIALYLIGRIPLRDFLKKEYLWALTIFLVITLPWYLLMLLKHGNLFFVYYMNEHVDKFYAERHYVFRVWVGLFFYLLPWSFLFLDSIYRVFKRGEYLNRSNSFLLLWLGVFLIIFLFPNQKSHYYAIPMLPPALLIIGGVLSRAEENENRPFKTATALVIALLILVLSGAIWILNNSSGWFFALIILLLFLAILSILRGSFRNSAVLFGLAVAFFYTLILPTLATSPIPAPIVLKLKHSGEQVFTFRISPVLYTDSLGVEVSEVRDYQNFVDQAPNGGALIIREADYDEISTKGTVLSSWMRWRRRIHVMECLRAFTLGNGDILKERVLLVGLEPL